MHAHLLSTQSVLNTFDTGFKSTQNRIEIKILVSSQLYNSSVSNSDQKHDSRLHLVFAEDFRLTHCLEFYSIICETETLGLSKNSLQEEAKRTIFFFVTTSLNVSFIWLSTSIGIVGLVYMITVNIISLELLTRTKVRDQ